MSEIDNEPLKNTILDILNHNDTPIDPLIEVLIQTVAEDLHEDMCKLIDKYKGREYINRTQFLTTMDEIFRTKFGSEYQEEEENVAEE